jgi:hypothetical protein
MASKEAWIVTDTEIFPMQMTDEDVQDVVRENTEVRRQGYRIVSIPLSLTIDGQKEPIVVDAIDILVEHSIVRDELQDDTPW